MIYLVWLLSLIATFAIGYKLRDLTTKIEVVQEVLKEKVDKKPVEEEPQSTLIDLTDEVKEAQYAHDQLMRKLNPDE